MSDQTRDPKTPRDFVDPAAWLYLPEAVARELHECARSNGRIDIDYLVAIYRCGREAARAADAQTIAQLRDEIATLKAERMLLRKFKEDVAAALCVENPDGPVSDEAVVYAADQTLSQLLDSGAELSTLRTESDRRVREALALGFEKGFKARCERAHPDATDPAQILEMKWRFDDGGIADDLEPVARAAFLAQRQEPQKP